MFVHLWDALAQVPPDATAVLIIRAILKMVTHALDRKDRWRRLMFLVVPLMVLMVALVGVAAWWLLADGGLQVVQHGFGQAVTPNKPSGTRANLRSPRCELVA